MPISLPILSLIHTAPPTISTLSLHDALPIFRLSDRESGKRDSNPRPQPWQGCALPTELFPRDGPNLTCPLPPGYRSEEHTSELQSHSDLVCRLLLEKKKSRMDEAIFDMTLTA